jgi:hypothetical protein
VVQATCPDHVNGSDIHLPDFRQAGGIATARTWSRGRHEWFSSIADVRGRVRFDGAAGDVSARARGAYLRTLQSWPDTD